MMGALRTGYRRVAGGVGRMGSVWDEYWTASYSQEGEDILLTRLLGERTQGFFIDVGAHHPRRFSNTFLFYRRGWRGINIEPSPVAVREFDRLRPRDINVAVGVGETPGELEYFVFDDPALNTFSAELMRSRETDTPYRVIGRRKIPVERLDTLLQRVLPQGQRVDFLSIDTEDFDLQVLRSNDWRLYRPEIVLVEALDFALSSASGHPVHQFMTAVNYELIAKTMNTLFYRNVAVGA
jgi:FkbM family methyltransferase